MQFWSLGVQQVTNMLSTLDANIGVNKSRFRGGLIAKEIPGLVKVPLGIGRKEERKKGPKEEMEKGIKDYLKIREKTMALYALTRWVGGFAVCAFAVCA